MNSPPDPDSDVYVGVVAGAKIVGVSENTLRRWADDGRIATFRTPGNQRRFKVADLRNLFRPERVEEAS
jgi:excisionase family DNA binding protein